jgi:hypothetical protein
LTESAATARSKAQSTAAFHCFAVSDIENGVYQKTTRCLSDPNRPLNFSAQKCYFSAYPSNRAQWH